MRVSIPQIVVEFVQISPQEHIAERSMQRSSMCQYRFQQPNFTKLWRLFRCTSSSTLLTPPVITQRQVATCRMVEQTMDVPVAQTQAEISCGDPAYSAKRFSEGIVEQSGDVLVPHREGHPSTRVFSTQWSTPCTCPFLTLRRTPWSFFRSFHKNALQSDRCADRRCAPDLGIVSRCDEARSSSPCAATYCEHAVDVHVDRHGGTHRSRDGGRLDE